MYSAGSSVDNVTFCDQRESGGMSDAGGGSSDEDDLLRHGFVPSSTILRNTVKIATIDGFG
jgi:hypothetical protein